MVVEQELVPYFEWLFRFGGTEMGAFWRFLITILVAAVMALVAGYLVALVRHGPMKAGDLTYRAVTGGVAELFRLSSRRIFALARLAIQEAMRRRVWVALLVFVFILMFATWFLRTNHQEPAKLFLTFVLTATTFLLLLMSLLMSTFSLPNEFKSKTIYTIVTKPVRAGDIVLGRFLGFTVLGTVFLLVMAVCSYVFVARALSHTHAVELDSLENVTDAEGNVVYRRGRSTLDEYHRHELEVSPEGGGIALSEHGHEHEIRLEDGRYVFETPREIMRARVPQYGRLRFLDRKGTPVEKGISVGAEWTYRSYIEGGTAAAAIWTFSDIDASKLRKDPDGAEYLPIELIVRVFRTYKGDIERGIEGSIQLRNPDTDLKSNVEIFTAKDITIDSFDFPRQLYDTDQQAIDLLDDLVTEDGRIEVWVQCLKRAQYYGFAQPDCFIRRPDASPLMNFAKGCLSIWIQMVLVIAIGVTCSTFLNGPVAMMFTVSFIILGFFREFFYKVATGTQIGGGPIESLVRIVTQKNLTARLEEGIGTQIMYLADDVLQLAMQSVSFLLPDFSTFSTVNYVAYGFDIPWSLAMQGLTTGLAFVFGLFLVGYFCLRTREVAK